MAGLALASSAVAGCGGDDAVDHGDPGEIEKVRAAVVSFYSSHDPRVCRSPGALSFIRETARQESIDDVERLIRSCERNRRAGRVIAAEDVAVPSILLSGSEGEAYSSLSGRNESTCGVLGVKKTRGEWRIQSLDPFECDRLP